MDQTVIEGYKRMREAMAESYRLRDFRNIFSSGTAPDVAHPSFPASPLHPTFAGERTELKNGTP